MAMFAFPDPDADFRLRRTCAMKTAQSSKCSRSADPYHKVEILPLFIFLQPTLPDTLEIHP
ncbi:hypothetical protein FHY12_003712 [Xanthomonas arboricola]|nr:hypothetical protein [Xanthomonas euroxanthea]